jgi:hypothetical protein
VNRDPTPANEDAFFSAPEPKTPPMKWGGKKLGLVALGLLVLTVLGNFARQPIANLFEQVMLPADTKSMMRTGEIPGVTLPTLTLQGYGICGLGLELRFAHKSW